ncbi:MAG: hypothetical protein KBA53_02660 [Thermoclostridium sp.]|nr:hypothetical protein [Thermoclostridium sp.]
MGIQFESEKLCDYSAMTSISQEAFHEWHPDNWHVSDLAMTELPKQDEDFARDLSLIAEIAGEDSGHVLFSIYQFIVADTAQKSAVAATAFLCYPYCKKHHHVSLSEQHGAAIARAA